MWRRTIIFLAIMVGVLGGVMVALKSPRVEENLKERLAQLAHNHLGVRLEIDTLDLELFPPAVTLTTVQAFRPEVEKPWFELHKARVQVRPWPSSSGVLVVEHLELDGLRGRFEIPTGDPEEPTPEEDASEESGFDLEQGLPFDIKRLLVWNTNLEIVSGDTAVSLKGVDVAMQPSDDGGRALQLDIPGGRVVHAKNNVRFETHVRALLEGTLDRPESVTIERSRFYLPQVSVALSGGMKLQHNPELGFVVEGAADLARVRDLVPSLPDLGGNASWKIELKGTPLSPLVRTQVLWKDVRLVGRELGEIETHAVYESGNVNVEAFRVSHPRGGTVTGSGNVKLTKELPITLTAGIRRASLAYILDRAGLSDAWVDLYYTGEASGKGTLFPLSLNLQTKATVEDFKTLSGSYASASSETILGIRSAEISGPVVINERAVYLPEMSIRTGENTDLKAETTLAFDTTIGLDLRASGVVDMKELGPIGSVPFEGKGDLAATLEGPYEELIISGTAELDNFGVLEFPLGNTKATLIADGDTLSIDRVAIRRGAGLISGAGRIKFGEGVPSAEGAFELADLDTADVLESIGLPPRHARRIRGKLSGRALVNGPLDAPEGILSFRMPELTVDGVSLGKATLTGGLGVDDLVAYGDLETELNDGAISLYGAYKEDTTIALHADLTNIRWETLTPLMGDVELSGPLNAKARLSGAADALSGPVSLNTTLVAYGVNLGKVRLSGDTQDGEITLEGTILSKGAQVDGTLKLNETLTYAATASFLDLELGKAVDLPNDLKVRASGTVFSQGALADPDTIIADAQLDKATARWEGFAMTAARPVRLNYHEGDVQILDFAWAGSGVTASVGGKISEEGALGLRMIARGDLALAAALESKIDAASGDFELDVSASGKLESPQLKGGAWIERGNVRLAGLDQLVENISASMLFAGNNMKIERGAATLGEGRIAYNGNITLEDTDQTFVDLRVGFENVTARPYPEVVMTGSGKLNLLGPTTGLELKGSLDLESFSYEAPLISLESLLPSRSAPPLKVPTFSPGESMALRVAIKADDQVRIHSSGVLDAELSADLMLTGTTERVGLLGNVRTKWGNAYYRDTEFKIEQASIDFVEEFSVQVQYTARATAEACNLETDVQVSGDSRDNPPWTVTVTGRDDQGATVSQIDVIACLGLGRREEDFSGHAAQNVDAKWLGAEILWQYSGVEAQIRRVLPVDEVRLTQGWSNVSKRTTPRLIIAKKVGEKAEFRYNGSLLETDDYVIQLQYHLNDNATFEGSWNSISEVQVGDFGLDLRLHWELR